MCVYVHVCVQSLVFVMRGCEEKEEDTVAAVGNF